MKPLWIAALVLVCLLIAAGCAPAAPPAPPPTPEPLPTPAPDLVAPVKAWAEAINKGDVEAALAPLADDVTLLGHGYWSISSATGKERVRPGFDYLVGIETMFRLKNCELHADRVACELSYVDGCTAAHGLPDGLTGKLESLHQPDARIRELSLATQNDPQWEDFHRFLRDCDGWALVNRAEEYTKSYLQSREGGAIMAKLCEEYAESLKAPADPASTVKAWLDAMNAGDVEAALALFTDDATSPALLEADNKEDLRDNFGWLVGLEPQFGAPDCQPRSEGLVCTFTWIDSCMAASGASGGLGLKGTFVIQPDGKIRTATLFRDGEAFGAYELWEQKMRAWAKANRPEEWARYVEHGKTKEGSLVWAKFCQEYAESLKAMAPTPAADLTAPVKAWADALNKGDVEAALALFADDPKWIGEAEGKKQVRAMFDYLVGMETRYQVKECRPPTESVLCTLSMVDACRAACAGADGLPMDIVFTYGPDGRVKQASTLMDRLKWEECMDFYSAMHNWARANRAEQYAKLSYDTREGGAMTVKLCQEYAATLK